MGHEISFLGFFVCFLFTAAFVLYMGVGAIIFRYPGDGDPYKCRRNEFSLDMLAGFFSINAADIGMPLFKNSTLGSF